MYTDCVTAPEVASSVGAGGLVRTYESVAIFEVGVSVPFDLPEIRVPVVTVSNPAENRHPPTEGVNCPTITVFVIAAASFISATPPTAVLEDSAASVGLQKRYLSDVLKCHTEGVLTRRSLKPTEGDRGMHTARWRNGARGGRLLMTGSATEWNCIRKNKPAPVFLTHPPTRSC